MILPDVESLIIKLLYQQGKCSYEEYRTSFPYADFFLVSGGIPWRRVCVYCIVNCLCLHFPAHYRSRFKEM